MHDDLRNDIAFWSGPDGFRHSLDTADERARRFGSRWRFTLLLALGDSCTGRIAVAGSALRSGSRAIESDIPFQSLWTVADRGTIRWALDTVQEGELAILISGRHGAQSEAFEAAVLPLVIDGGPARHAIATFASAGVPMLSLAPGTAAVTSLRTVPPLPAPFPDQLKPQAPPSLRLVAGGLISRQRDQRPHPDLRLVACGERSVSSEG